MKFDIKKIYLKDASFESPRAPLVFTEQKFNPSVAMDLSVSHAPVAGHDDHYDVVLAVTMTASAAEQTVFLVELQQAGIFEIGGVAGDELKVALEVACPNVLLPFAREAASDLTAKGGFPPMLLAPFNFEALYRQKREAESAPKAEASGETADDADLTHH